MAQLRNILLGVFIGFASFHAMAERCVVFASIEFTNREDARDSDRAILDYATIEVAIDTDFSKRENMRHMPNIHPSDLERLKAAVKAFGLSRAEEIYAKFPRRRGTTPEIFVSRCNSDMGYAKIDFKDRHSFYDPEAPAHFYLPLRGDWTQYLRGPIPSAATNAEASRNLSKDEIAQANYERLKLERDKPGSREARDAAARYHALLGKQKFTAEDVAMANYERLKAQRDNPGSKEAREAAARYNAMRGQQAGDRNGPTVSKDELAMANYERLRLAREKPGSAEAKVAASGYQALLKASQAQDRPARIRGPVLTRVGPDKPSADDVAARKKAQDAERKRKADEAAIVRTREAEDKKKAQARENILRASCMKPENRGACGCLRFYPGSSGGTCSR